MYPITSQGELDLNGVFAHSGQRRFSVRSREDTEVGWLSRVPYERDGGVGFQLFVGFGLRAFRDAILSFVFQFFISPTRKRYFFVSDLIGTRSRRSSVLRVVQLSWQ